MGNWFDFLTQQKTMPIPHHCSPPPFCFPLYDVFLQQWALGSRFATVLENDSTRRFRVAVAGTTFPFYPLLSLSTIIENPVYYSHIGNFCAMERIWIHDKILFRLQKLCPSKFGLVMNLPVLVPHPMVCFSYTASVRGVFAKIWHKQEP